MSGAVDMRIKCKNLCTTVQNDGHPSKHSVKTLIRVTVESWRNSSITTVTHDGSSELPSKGETPFVPRPWNSTRCTWDGSKHPFLLNLPLPTLSLPSGNTPPVVKEPLDPRFGFLFWGSALWFLCLPGKPFVLLLAGGAGGEQNWGHGWVI